MTSTGAALLVRALALAGVRYLFTLSGNQILSIYDACLDYGIELIHVRHESAATYMADAWGRLTEQPGVALVTAGPGHTNALTPLYVAAAAESPVILLSGHCRTTELGMGAFQEMDQVLAAQPVTKASWMVRDPQQLGYDIAKAFRLARSGRPGPVHLSLPSDILDAPISEGEKQLPPQEAFQPSPAEGESSLIEEALDLLAQAHHPLILTGPAMARSYRWAAVTRLSEVTHLPVLPMESPRGLRDPLLGNIVELFAKADVVLLLGKKLDFTLHFGNPSLFTSTTRLIQVDPHPHSEHERMRLAIPGDPVVVTRQFLQRAEQRSWPERAAWQDRIAYARQRGREEWQLWEQSDQSPIHPLRLFRELRPYFTKSTIFISDGGEFGQWAQAALSASTRLINGPSGAIGGGIPFALAAKLAHPDALVVALMGDGAFGFHALEFDTAVRYGLPILVVLGNDAAWNAEKQLQIKQYGPERVVGCDLLPTRYDRLVEALGGHGEYVEKPADLSLAFDRAIRADRPACVNIRIEGIPAP